MKKVFVIVAVAAVLSACSIKQVVEKAEIPKKKLLCVVENKDVRAGFLEEFKRVLNSKSIPYKMISKYSTPSACEWTATYVARWTWDLALYMSYAEIKVFNNGRLDGKATYDSTRGSANMGKFIDAETKIRELMNELLQYKSSSLFGVFYSQS